MALTPNSANELVTVDPDLEFRGVAAAISQPGNIHNVSCGHIAALTLYNEHGERIQYREPHDDRDIVEAVYRWDERPYREIFRTGFCPRPRDEQITRLEDYYNLERHVNGGGSPADGSPDVSVFVSTTRSTSWRPRVTERMFLFRYEIFAPGGIDTVLTIPCDRHNYRNQQEIAFVGGISPQYIRTAREFAIDCPPESRFPIYMPWGDYIYHNGNFNPNPNSSNGGQTSDEFMNRLRNVRRGNCMIISFCPRTQQHHIEKRDTEVDTTTPLVKEEPYVDPICSVGHYIECAFNFSNSRDAYLFIADRCLHINYAPNNKIINGPMSIGYGFPYLRDTIFASGIDAAFTSSTKNEAYIFRNNIYALINFVDDGGRIIQGPKKITDSFYSLKGTIFEHGIDAAFTASYKSEAYIFKGDQYALINFAPGTTKDYIIQGPKKITDSFYSLKGTIFQNGFDAAFSSTTKNEAYIFKGNFYALIDYAPGTTDDKIIDGPTTPISDGFRSLRDIIPMYPRGF